MKLKLSLNAYTQSIFVLDTNVILYDPNAVLKFKNSDIYIPFSVIEEIDRFKKDMGENGRNARYFSRFIDDLRGQGKLSEGVLLESTSSYVHVVSDFKTPYDPSLNGSADNRILGLTVYIEKTYSKKKVTLITQDINMRIKADVLGLVAEDYDVQDVDFEDLYSGQKDIDISSKDLVHFYKQKSLVLDDEKLISNQYVIMKDAHDKKRSALGRYDSKKKHILPLLSECENAWGVHPRNTEQSFALDSLLNDKISVVTVLGKAGTGKTLLALAAALQKTLEERCYHRILVSRPIFPMGRDIGYLPGDVEEKLNPWMQPIFDNIEFLMDYDKTSTGRARELIHQGIINIEPLTYIRGRSIPKQFLIVDEAQNLTPHEVKTIITRAGEGTKVVLTGDPYQIDNPYVDSSSSGLTYVIERFKGHPISAHVTLSRGERSELAELAANLL